MKNPELEKKHRDDKQSLLKRQKKELHSLEESQLDERHRDEDKRSEDSDDVK